MTTTTMPAFPGGDTYVREVLRAAKEAVGIKQLARSAGRSPKTVEDWIYEGKLPRADDVFRLMLRERTVRAGIVRLFLQADPSMRDELLRIVQDTQEPT